MEILSGLIKGKVYFLNYSKTVKGSFETINPKSKGLGFRIIATDVKLIAAPNGIVYFPASFKNTIDKINATE